MNATTSPSPCLTLKDVTFGYSPEKIILDIPSFEVKSGEKLFLYGPSGSGKTTLLGLLAGILSPNSGKIRVLDQDFSGLSNRKKDAFRGEHLGYIFQMFNLIPFLSVQENIELPLRLNAARRARAHAAGSVSSLEKITKKLGIEPLLPRPVHQLSVGQQQRVAAARALLGAPEILIADEPTSALDSHHRAEFIELLFEQADSQNSTVVFVSHDEALMRLFQRVVPLHDLNRLSTHAPRSEKALP